MSSALEPQVQSPYTCKEPHRIQSDRRIVARAAHVGRWT